VPVHFWQSVQWQRAVTAASPWEGRESGWRFARQRGVPYSVFVVDFTTHATAFCHCKCGLADVADWWWWLWIGAEMYSAVVRRCGVYNKSPTLRD
jgi:hypothetical protein